MKIAFASDHAGFELKRGLLAHFEAAGLPCVDLGTHGTEPVDYPDRAETLGLAILRGQAARGILICGSGVGASIAANKLPGIRAAVCHDPYSAHQGVEHDDMNVLVLGARVVALELAQELVERFVRAVFARGVPRHERRVAKIDALERRYQRRSA